MSDCKLKLESIGHGYHRVRVSFDGGIAWSFIGNMLENRSFDLLSQYLALDEADRTSVLRLIEQDFPGYQVNILKPPPPGFDND